MPTSTTEENYQERTDRNIGWLTREEQEILRQNVVGIAGCGGMGGLLAATLVRVGIGEVRIADSEVFDTSNINRQFSARDSTVGKSKAHETLKDLQAITTTVKLVAYPDGITPLSVDHFAKGCSIICDEIEFWASASRILLHQSARKYDIPVMNCSSVGFGSRLRYFTPQGHTIEEMLGATFEEAIAFEERLHAGTVSALEIEERLHKTLAVFAPELPRYTPESGPYDDRTACIERLLLEQKASIVGSNPVLATGLVANHIVLQLLSLNGSDRAIPSIPTAPGYLYLDSAFLSMKSVFAENSHV